MSEDKVKELYEAMVKMFGDKIPNYEHQPKAFEFYVKMYKFYSKDLTTE